SFPIFRQQFLSISVPGLFSPPLSSPPNPTFTLLSERGGPGGGERKPPNPRPWAEMSKKRKALEGGGGGGEPQLPEEEPTAWFGGSSEEPGQPGSSAPEALNHSDSSKCGVKALSQ
ncbi:hypothetical protein STEG23_003547, partial [Scotinomys teguina]